MKKYIIAFILSGLIFSVAFAQEEEEKDKPVRAPFESGYLIDNQTTMIPIKGTLEYAIQHKFGTMENGLSDVWGIYAPGANIRLALNYVPATNLQIGMGLAKKNMYTDLNAKWTILEQTRENSVPVAVSLYGAMAIDGRNENSFGTGKVWHSGEGLSEFDITFADRFSYFSQLIIGRKFTHWLSLQAAASFTHYNMVGHEYDHDKVGLHFNGRLRFSYQSSFIFNYDVPLKIKQLSEQTGWVDHPKPNLAVGVEISTSTHAFQIYAGSSDGIIPQDVIMWNQNDWKNEGMAFGFTITRLWNF